jgi:hypothetical protein
MYCNRCYLCFGHCPSCQGKTPTTCRRIYIFHIYVGVLEEASLLLQGLVTDTSCFSGTQPSRFCGSSPPLKAGQVHSSKLGFLFSLRLWTVFRIPATSKGCRRSQWPRGLRRRSAAERLLGSWVLNPPGAWMFVSCTVFVCCQVEVSVTGRSLIQRSPTDFDVCLSVIKWKQKPSTPTVNK